LKLREFSDGSGELIFYERPDLAGPKESLYVRCACSDPKAVSAVLGQALGVRGVVEKRRALLPMSEAFGRWERSELGSGELSEIIHRFHQGPARELWVRYNTPHLEMVVAFAITRGVLGRDTIPTELLEHLAGALRFYEEEQATT